MDIIVEGNGKKYYTPDQAKIDLRFYIETRHYEDALKNGTLAVETFIKKVLEPMNFEKESMKTRTFRIYETYEPKNNKKINRGFAYSQAASIKFDYSLDKVAEFMDRASKMSDVLNYQISFNVKDSKHCKEEALAAAYNNAKEKAEAIAKAAGKELKECVKTDFKPFDERIVSGSAFNGDDILFKRQAIGNYGVQGTIKEIFTPEDVEISETLYCLWLAE